MAFPKSIPDDTAAARGWPLALQNAKDHLRGAKLLASNGLPGIGIGLAVLAIEECAKAYILCLRSVGVEIPDEDVRAMLSRHISRHAAVFGHLFAIFSIRWAAEAHANAIEEFVRQDAFEEDAVRILEQAREERLHQILSGRGDPTTDFGALELIAEANESKNRAFYVDFDGVNWRMPSDFKPGHVDALVRVTEYYLNQVVTLVDAIPELSEPQLTALHGTLGAAFRDYRSKPLSESLEVMILQATRLGSQIAEPSNDAV